MKFYSLISAFAVAVTAKESRHKVELDQSPPTAPAQTDVLSSDFLTGFESGIFLRDKPDQVKDYGCPKAEVKIEEFVKVKKMIPAVTQIISVMNKEKDDEMENMLNSFSVFVDHIDELIGVFDTEYNGGQFCAGLTFGQSGSNLLYKIAEVIINSHIKSSEAHKKKMAENKEKH